MLYKVIGIKKSNGAEFEIPGPTFDSIFKAAKAMKTYQENMGPGYKFLIEPLY